MHNRVVALFALMAAAAWGQDVSRTYHFTNVKTTRGFNETASVLRIVGDLKDVTVDEAAGTLATHGSTDQMALADWLFPEVDQPSTGPALASHQYTMTGIPGVVRVFHFAHVPEASGAQEMVNVMRSGGDIKRVVSAWESRTMSVRGTSDQIAFAQWLFPQLDVSEPTPGAATQSYRLAGVPLDPEVRVIHLAHTPDPVPVQEMVNTIRTIGDMNRVFPCHAAGVLFLRGTAEMVAAGEWLASQLDEPSGLQGPAPHEQQLTTTNAPVAHVFYLSHALSPQSLQGVVDKLRTSVKLNRIYPNNQTGAVAVRGTTSQIAEAASLIAELDK